MRTDEAPDGRERLLRVTVRYLETHGEAALRVSDIAAEADVAIGLIRHHFGSRDGLVTAAQQRRLEGLTREGLAGVRTVLADITDLDDLVGRLRLLTLAVVDRQRADVRMSRFAALATAHGRPAVRDDLSGTIGDLLDELARVILEAQERGLVREDLDPRAIATFIQAYSLGLVVHDLDPVDLPDEAVADVITTASRAVLETS